MTKFDHLADLEKRLDDSGVGKTSDWLYYWSSRINPGVFKTTISKKERAVRKKIKAISKASKKRNRK